MPPLMRKQSLSSEAELLPAAPTDNEEVTDQVKAADNVEVTELISTVTSAMTRPDTDRTDDKRNSYGN